MGCSVAAEPAGCWVRARQPLRAMSRRVFKPPACVTSRVTCHPALAPPGTSARFLWDYWHVPGQYTLIRTQVRAWRRMAAQGGAWQRMAAHGAAHAHACTSAGGRILPKGAVPPPRVRPARLWGAHPGVPRDQPHLDVLLRRRLRPGAALRCAGGRVCDWRGAVGHLHGPVAWPSGTAQLQGPVAWASSNDSAFARAAAPSTRGPPHSRSQPAPPGPATLHRLLSRALCLCAVADALGRAALHRCVRPAGGSW